MRLNLPKTKPWGGYNFSASYGSKINNSIRPKEYYLKHRRNILSLTDFIVNAGGVIGCAVERKMIADQNCSKRVQDKDTRAYTENLIFDTVAKNMKDIISRMKEDSIFRDAATELAMERLETQEIWL
jgi:glutamate dehydrogenase (NAD(P)+)